MRGSAKSPPSYRKHKRSGQAIVTLSGKDVYLGPYGTKASRMEYDRVIVEWLANGRCLPKTNPATNTVADLIAAYWKRSKDYYVKNGEPTDEVRSLKVALQHVNRLYGKQLAEDFGPLALEAVREAMVAQGNSRGYINNQVARIRRMFRWCVAKQLVSPTVYQGLQALEGLKRGKCKARETDPILPIDDAIVEATLPHCRPEVADMIRFQRLTGCRPGEVRTIRPCEINRTKDVWRYFPGSHKMEHKGRSRVILIGPKAQAVLKPYLLRDVTSYCFERPKGGMYKRWNYNHAINNACDKAFPAPTGMAGDKLKEWKLAHRWAPNRLRHSAATAVRQEFGLEAAQAVLGHASADVTQVYAERDMEKAAAVMAKVG